jgi:hypothetical protein
MTIRYLILLSMGFIVSILAQYFFRKINEIVKKLYLVLASVCMIYVLSPYYDVTVWLYTQFFFIGLLCGGFLKHVFK